MLPFDAIYGMSGIGSPSNVIHCGRKTGRGTIRGGYLGQRRVLNREPIDLQELLLQLRQQLVPAGSQLGNLHSMRVSLCTLRQAHGTLASFKPDGRDRLMADFHSHVV